MEPPSFDSLNPMLHWLDNLSFSIWHHLLCKTRPFPNNATVFLSEKELSTQFLCSLFSIIFKFLPIFHFSRKAIRGGGHECLIKERRGILWDAFVYIRSYELNLCSSGAKGKHVLSLGYPVFSLSGATSPQTEALVDHISLKIKSGTNN